MTICRPVVALRFLAVCLSLLATGPAGSQERTDFPASGGQARPTLVIHAATDLAAMRPLIEDFLQANPDMAISYRDYQTNALFEAGERACILWRGSGGTGGDIDLIISSSVDQLAKLANDGCGLAHVSAETAAVPAWARWRDEVFGFTFEPAVMVYNRNLLPAEAVPRSRAQLLDLLQSRGGDLSGRVATYDITRSGIGFLFALYDAFEGAASQGRLIEALARAGVRTFPSSAEMVREIGAGRLTLGYNILGSYAYRGQRDGEPIGIVVPRDYVLVLSRGIMIPAFTRQAGLARRFLDYLLSPRGQARAREGAFPFGASLPLPASIDGPPLLAQSGPFRPISISVELLAVRDRAKRSRFLLDYERALRSGR